MRIINIKLIPNSKKQSILEEDEKFKIHVKSPARENKANRELSDLLANYFNVKASDIEIIKGAKSRKKIVKILNFGNKNEN